MLKLMRFCLFFFLLVNMTNGFNIRGKPPPTGKKYACDPTYKCEECINAGCIFLIQENDDTHCGDFIPGILYKSTKAPPYTLGKCDPGTTTTTEIPNLSSSEYVIPIIVLSALVLMIIFIVCCIKVKQIPPTNDRPPSPFSPSPCTSHNPPSSSSSSSRPSSSMSGLSSSHSTPQNPNNPFLNHAAETPKTRQTPKRQNMAFFVPVAPDPPTRRPILPREAKKRRADGSQV